MVLALKHMLLLVNDKSGKICLNGAASRLVEVDDVVIIMTYVQLDERELVDHAPKVAVMNEKNEIIQMIHEKKEQ